MNMHFLLYSLIGIIAGLASGLLGIGGGLIVVPSLAFAFSFAGIPQGIIMHLAAGTSLAAMIVTAVSAIFAHNRLNNVLWPVVLRLLPAITLGVISGAVFASYLTTHWLQVLFGLFLLVISIQMLFLSKPKPTRSLPQWPVLSLVGFLIGLKSGLLGLGGGAVIIPFLVYCNVPMRKASGTSIACTFPIAVVGTITFIILGLRVNQIPYSTGYIYWPAFLGVSVMTVIFAQVGAWLNGKINVALLKRLFAAFLFFISIRLLF